jgi:hypothetical protein
MSAYLAPGFGAGFQAFSNSGAVLAGGLLYTYQAGSTTAQATWTTSTQLVQNTNPVVLNSAGRPANEIWLQGGSAYKFVLADSVGNILATWDNVPGTNDANYNAFSEWVAFGSAPTYVSSTSFTVSGNQTSTLQVNRRVQCNLVGSTIYATILTSSYNSGTGLTTITLTLDSSGLDATLYGFSYGFMSATNTSLPAGSYAPTVSPTFTGNPTAPTQAAADNSTKLATDAFVQTAATGAVSVSVTGSANVTLTSAQYGVRIVTLTGVLTGNISVDWASQAGVWFVQNATTGSFSITLKANVSDTGVTITQGTAKQVISSGATLVSANTDLTGLTLANPTLTGTVTVPTQAGTDNSTKAASTAFVQSVAMSAALPAQGGHAGQYPTTDGASASWGKISWTYAAVTASLTISAINNYSSVTVLAPTNAVTVPTAFTTSDGWSVTTNFSAGTLAALSSTSYSTAHGTWGAKTMTPPTISTLTIAGTSAVYGTVQLDTDLVAVLFRDGTNIKVAAMKPSTGALTATPQTVCAFGAATTPNSIFKVSTTSFIAFANSAASDWTSCAGSVNTSDLSITLGSPQTGGAVGTALQAPAQLTATLYCITQNAANDVRAISVSGTAVTIGTAVASGAYTNAANVVRVARSSNTEAMIVYLATGGGTSSTRNLSARIGSISGTTITLQSASAAATNIEGNTGLNLLMAFTEGTSYLAVCANGAVGTSGDFYGISASGTTATVGTVTTRVTDLPAATNKGTWVYAPAIASMKYDGSTIVLGHKSNGPYAVTISGTTLTFGSQLNLGGTVTLINDTTGAITYAIGSAAYDKITVAAGVITSSFQVTVAPTIVASDTLSDKAVSYSGTFYTWALPAMTTAITASGWLYASGNNFIYTGPIN